MLLLELLLSCRRLLLSHSLPIGLDLIWLDKALELAADKFDHALPLQPLDGILHGLVVRLLAVEAFEALVVEVDLLIIFLTSLHLLRDLRLLGLLGSLVLLDLLLGPGPLGAGLQQVVAVALLDYKDEREVSME